MLGDVPPSAPQPSRISRLKSQLEPRWLALRELAKRRIAVGRKQVPLGAIGGALFGLPLVVALAFSAASGGASGQAGAADSATAATPVDDDLAELVRECVLAKAPAHGINTIDFVRPERAMYQIGG